MALKVTRQGTITIVHPAGAVDARAAFQFEQDALELLQDGGRHVIVDMSAVTLLASAGIRVLILMLHKLEARDGMLVLCGLSHHVRTVFEVSGLSGQFTIVGTPAEAMILLLGTRRLRGSGGRGPGEACASAAQPRNARSAPPR